MPQPGLVITDVNDVTVVNFRDSSVLDSAAVDNIAKQLYELVDAQAKRKLVLDFTDVNFLSSQMIGVMVALHKKSCNIKGRFVICGLKPRLFEVFKITRLDKILDFAKDERQAITSFEM